MAHIVPNMLLARLRQMPLLPQDREQPEPQPSDKTDTNDGLYHPTPIDIVVVRTMLTRSVKLPPDLVDAIFDYAEYWAHSTNVIDYQAEQQEPLRINGSSMSEDKFLLRSYPIGLTGIEGQDTLSKELAYDTREAMPRPAGTDHDQNYFARVAKYPTPRLIHPVRKVVFKIKSHDQGWGGDAEAKGTYRASWTWFEAGLERFDAAHKCDPQCTRDARQETPGSDSPSLPVCALRPIYPNIEQVQNDREGDGDNSNNDSENKEAEEPEVKYRYVHPLEGQAEWEIHRNKSATSDWQEHHVTWSYLDDTKADSDAGKALDDAGRGRATGDGSFVRSLLLGDVITVWGKARFGGWVNNVDNVKIEVFWAV
ncbi:ankyrin repeat protein [Pochonia chlamydosporia 170]|uniref:Ankyrin repeat protein n=1 Tax=Pochonia chlamydosporia 170 TaxID=1380566 RepID=A0A179F3S4_METCM|nr:ankyrin repeat protein [Pochonia chlamydosporia 170]OAQ60010.1 ankyrin repeat protein [Pochonia chlamydosporia 170]